MYVFYLYVNLSWDRSLHIVLLMSRSDCGGCVAIYENRSSGLSEAACTMQLMYISIQLYICHHIINSDFTPTLHNAMVQLQGQKQPFWNTRGGKVHSAYINPCVYIQVLLSDCQLVEAHEAQGEDCFTKGFILLTVLRAIFRPFHEAAK